MKRFICIIFLGFLALTSVSYADTLPTDTFTGSTQTYCCFEVVLTQTDADDISVTVSLTGKATSFVNSGNSSGNHPGFAFQFDNASGGTLDITTQTSGWALQSGATTSVSGGFGTFNTWFTAPGSGSNAGTEELQFSISDSNGISFSDFVENAENYYFVADINDEGTGISDIDTVPTYDPGTSAATPEPSSLALLGTGALGAAGLIRRRLVG